MGDSNDSIKSDSGFLGKVKDHSEAIIAIASIASVIVALILAMITYFHIDEAKQMRIETKRLVDSTIEQFKVTSYPRITIATTQGTISLDPPSDRIRLTNAGELTSFKTSGVVIYALEDKGDLLFWVNPIAVYESDSGEKRSIIDYDTEIGPKGSTIIASPRDTIDFDRLKYMLVIVRFKVPFADTYSYQIESYLKDSLRPPGDTFVWLKMTQYDRVEVFNKLIKYVDKKESDKEFDKKLQIFLRDLQL